MGQLVKKGVRERQLQYFSHFQHKSGDLNKFVLTRINEHPEVKSSSNGPSNRWLINKECYMCGRWTYSVLFFKVPKISCQKIKAPRISGTYSSYCGNNQKMISLNKFLKIINPKFISPSEQLEAYEGTLSDSDKNLMPKDFLAKKYEEILNRLNHQYTIKSLGNEYLRFFKP